MLAVGQTSGKVSFLSFKSDDAGDGKFLLTRDLTARTCRGCTALSWYRPGAGPGQSILAGGFEKHRSDHGLVVWDVSQVI